ncbi:MAG: hypothetical protein IKA81_02755 [Alistipes sp.]|nr:hypothetical protein [Alistipes sp.]
MGSVCFVGSVGSMGSMGSVGKSPSNPLDPFNPSDPHCFAVAGHSPATQRPRSLQLLFNYPLTPQA